MPFFRTASARRHTTCLVLLVWIFALASGVANACVVQERTTHTHINPLTVSDPSWIRTTAVTHDESASNHEESAGLSIAPCLKVCDQGSQSPVKHPTPTDLHVLPATFDSTHWDVLLPVAQAMPAIPDVRRTTAPPIRVRYVRLAL